MGTSFVAIDSKGFWCDDALLEVWLWLLAGELLELHPDEAWAADLAESWLIQATAGFVGSISVDLDGIPPEYRGALPAVVASARARIQAEPRLLSADTLNAQGMNTERRGDLDYETLAPLAEMFALLLAGRVPWGPGDPEALPAWWYYQEVRPG